jgi:MFS family permease
MVALGADHGLFIVGLSFVSTATILPAFASSLGAPSVVIGAIPAVMTLGWFLPSLFTAGHIETLPRKLPFVLRWTLLERLPWAILAMAAFFLAERAPTATLALLLAILLVIASTGGVLIPAWMAIIGAAVPETLRGRFFGFTHLAASGMAFAGSFLTTWILATVELPRAFGWCFLCTTAAVAVSYVALATVREPAARTTADAVPLRAYLERMPGLLRRDRNLTAYLVARALAIVGWMSATFFTVYALRAWDAPAAQAGVFTAFYLAGHMAGTLAFGWLADRVGHRLVLAAGAAAMLGANVAAVAAPTLTLFDGVFVLFGVQMAAVNVSQLSILLEFAPDPSARPTYIGLGTTLVAPVSFLAPIGAGLLADAVGFRLVFGLAAVAGAAAVTVFLAGVHDPRHARIRALLEPGT